MVNPNLRSENETSSSEFKPGDKAILKSDGPVMTMQEVRPMAICEWVSDKGAESMEFPPECLKRAGGS